MTALIGYQTALLARSQRWLPPFLLYAVLLAIGVQTGRPVLDSLGYAAAVLLPVTAWLVRICATQEPAAARAVVAAAAGPPRAHLAALGAAAVCATGLGVAGTAVVALVSTARSADDRTPVPLPEAVAAGLLAVAVCVLTGAAVGALCTRPLLHGRGWSLAATALAALLALVTTGSPAKHAVTALVTGSRTGSVRFAWPALAGALLLAAAAVAAACALTSRRGSAAPD
ncbi:ABC transporter [Streptomyces sp. NPDC014894]|uniref:ABC transporter n=1 Tax=Streptomyces sp. NPDC014894 TaxID=3364931 RepID=UPI0036F5EA06